MTVPSLAESYVGEGVARQRLQEAGPVLAQDVEGVEPGLLVPLIVVVQVLDLLPQGPQARADLVHQAARVSEQALEARDLLRKLCKVLGGLEPRVVEVARLQLREDVLGRLGREGGVVAVDVADGAQDALRDEGRT